MPRRTNRFQQIVKYIYEQITPVGGKIIESAMLREANNGAEREVDILIEHSIAGHSILIAVECHDRGRRETIEWIDGLIGKYHDLKVNKVVAVARTTFRSAAMAKALKHNIDPISVNEALTTNWRERIETWRFLAYNFLIMRVTATDEAGRIITDTHISDDEKITHTNQRSEFVYEALVPTLMEEAIPQIKNYLTQSIVQTWDKHRGNFCKPAWLEYTLSDLPGVTIFGRELSVDKIVFGIGIFFHVGSPADHFALREYAVSEIKIKTKRGDIVVKLLTDSAGNVLDGLTINALAPLPPQPEHFSPTRATSTIASSPCLRMSVSTGIGALRPHALHVASRIHPGGV